MAHLGGDGALGALLGVHHHVGLFVNGLALGEQFADGPERVGLLQQRPVALVLGALVKSLGTGPKADDQRVRLEAGEVLGIHNGTAASGDDQALALAQFGDDFPLELAKGRLASVENISEMGSPARSTTSRSVSTNSKPSSPATCRPTVDLPQPMKPTRAILEMTRGPDTPAPWANPARIARLFSMRPF